MLKIENYEKLVASMENVSDSFHKIELEKVKAIYT